MYTLLKIFLSGGKDSHYQVYVITKIFGLKPLLVTYNHQFNTPTGIENMYNMADKFGCDHLRFSPNIQIIKKLSRSSFKKMGDMCWHCHAGIFTYPVQIAVKYKIPLLIWGEQGFLDLGGMFSHKDLVEMTEKFRTEHGLRGYDWKDMIDAEEGITEDDLAWAKYPSDEEIEKVGIRGIYLGNYFPWDNVKQTELMIKEFGFKPSPEPYDRTYTRFENVEC